ncbi:LacI family DNA-binding transcriptional regulator [Isoptericola sp. NPDC057653]|uniref:LacI family DNA-binding transcriptional regulator n=1 Tax=Isoptericola sp. NPDC057653 TaxID=3346195 RepID=UPI00369A7458
MPGPERTGARPVRLLDVAERAGVSKKTVSAVLNNVGQVRTTTRERVLEAVRDLDYRPNPAALRLSSSRTGTVTLALPHLGSAEHAALASAVIDAGERAGVGVLCEPTGGSAAREADVLRAEVGSSDGVLLVPSSTEVDLPDGSVVVVLGDHDVGLPVDHVIASSSAATRRAVARLAAAGRRRIAVLRAPGGPASGPRWDDTSRADPAVVDVVVDADTGAAGDAAVRRLLAQDVRFDALVAGGEAVAFGALHALRTHGLSVPADVAVVAVGGGPEAEFSRPSITTVAPDYDEMAAVALDWLLQRIAGDDAPARYHEVALRTVERGSTPGPER